MFCVHLVSGGFVFVRIGYLLFVFYFISCNISGLPLRFYLVITLVLMSLGYLGL